MSMASSSSSDDEPNQNVKVPKPKKFGGSQNAKELENVLWVMEHYVRLLVCGIQNRLQSLLCILLVIQSFGDVLGQMMTLVLIDQFEIWDSMKKKEKGSVSHSKLIMGCQRVTREAKVHEVCSRICERIQFFDVRYQ